MISALPGMANRSFIPGLRPLPGFQLPE